MSTDDKSVSFIPDMKIGGVVPRDVYEDSTSYLPPVSNAPPTKPGEVDKRLVVKEGMVSVVVDDLNKARDQIVSYIEEKGGYIVSLNTYGVDQNQSSSIEIRLPQETFDEALKFIKSIALKVTSESISGQDVTDQYVDEEARLKSLQDAKSRYEEILKSAVTIEEILQIQAQIDITQTQIEQAMGRMSYMEKTAQMSRITINVAIDEASLPYVAPSEKWRPQAVFKQALRSIISAAKELSYSIIWVAVYAVIWVPVGLVGIFLWKRFKKGL